MVSLFLLPEAAFQFGENAEIQRVTARNRIKTKNLGNLAQMCDCLGGGMEDEE